MKRSKVLSVLLSAALAVFFLTAAVAFPILCRPFYYAQAASLELSARTGWSEAVIHEAYNEVMDYLVYGAEFGTGSLRWSEDGRAHFEDCRRLFRLDFILLGGAAAALAAFAALSRRVRPHHFGGRSPAFWAAAVMTALFLAAALWAVADFNGLFTAFHHAFFPGKTNWVFDARLDEIILILPEAFWARTGALVLALSLGGAWAAAAVWAAVKQRR